MMNQFVGIATPKKDLLKTFEIVCKEKDKENPQANRVKLEDIKAIAKTLA